MRWTASRRLVVLGALLVAGLALLGRSGAWQAAPTQAAPAPSPTPAPTRDPSQPVVVAEQIFTAATGLAEGWEDWGWAERDTAPGTPARLDFSGAAGWILGKRGLKGAFGELLFKLHAPAEFGEFMEVHLDSDRASFPHIKVTAAVTHDLVGGWSEVAVPFSALNPQGMPFDRVVLRAGKLVAKTRVEIDDIRLTQGVAAPVLAAGRTDGPSRSVTLTLDCAAPSSPISPLIYGIAWKPGHDQFDRHQWRLGATARRFGGNPTSRYNWRLGNAWNTAGDWFFRNIDYAGEPGWTYRRFLTDNRSHAMASALTLPLLDWVAKDTTSYSFPVGIFGPQQAVAPEQPDAGNGMGPNGKPLPAGSPTRTSVRSSPSDIAEWVSTIRREDGSGTRSVDVYILDNEPMLWDSTHRDVHPDPVSYDELLRRTIDYGTAVRQSDPGATVAGPALWGWPAYMSSAVDAKAGFLLRPDRRAHGDVPLLPWWLREVQAYEKRSGVRLIDLVDVHFYPQGDRIAGGNAGLDPETAARRIRSTRALWDPSYRDESWIDESIELLPRLKRWIDENHPGLGIQIGEYNFGAEEHMSGALALAEALGRFGEGGVHSAFYWTYPPAESPAFWAFRAYRDFDGQGGHFLDRTLAVHGSGALMSAFASQSDDGGRIAMVLLNHNPDLALKATVDAGGCGVIETGRSFSYAGGAGGFVATSATVEKGSVQHSSAPYSISVLDLKVARRGTTPSPAATGARP